MDSSSHLLSSRLQNCKLPPGVTVKAESGGRSNRASNTCAIVSNSHLTSLL